VGHPALASQSEEHPTIKGFHDRVHPEVGRPRVPAVDTERGHGGVLYTELVEALLNTAGELPVVARTLEYEVGVRLQSGCQSKCGLPSFGLLDWPTASLHRREPALVEDRIAVADLDIVSGWRLSCSHPEGEHVLQPSAAPCWPPNLIASGGGTFHLVRKEGCNIRGWGCEDLLYGACAYFTGD
jgi:hypothetical protein